jgi:hypothetical protein
MGSGGIVVSESKDEVVPKAGSTAHGDLFPVHVPIGSFGLDVQEHG